MAAHTMRHQLLCYLVFILLLSILALSSSSSSNNNNNNRNVALAYSAQELFIEDDFITDVLLVSNQYTDPECPDGWIRAGTTFMAASGDYQNLLCYQQDPELPMVTDMLMIDDKYNWTDCPPGYQRIQYVRDGVNVTFSTSPMYNFSPAPRFRHICLERKYDSSSAVTNITLTSSDCPSGSMDLPQVVPTTTGSCLQYQMTRPHRNVAGTSGAAPYLCYEKKCVCENGGTPTASSDPYSDTCSCNCPCGYTGSRCQTATNGNPLTVDLKGLEYSKDLFPIPNKTPVHIKVTAGIAGGSSNTTLRLLLYTEPADICEFQYNSTYPPIFDTTMDLTLNNTTLYEEEFVMRCMDYVGNLTLHVVNMGDPDLENSTYTADDGCTLDYEPTTKSITVQYDDTYVTDLMIVTSSVRWGVFPQCPDGWRSIPRSRPLGSSSQEIDLNSHYFSLKGGSQGTSGCRGDYVIMCYKKAPLHAADTLFITQYAMAEFTLDVLIKNPLVSSYFAVGYFDGTYNTKCSPSRLCPINLNLGLPDANSTKIYAFYRGQSTNQFTVAFQDFMLVERSYADGKTTTPCPPSFYNAPGYLSQALDKTGQALDLNFSYDFYINNHIYLCYRPTCTQFKHCQNGGYQNAFIPPLGPVDTQMTWNARLACNCTCVGPWTGEFCNVSVPEDNHESSSLSFSDSSVEFSDTPLRQSASVIAGVVTTMSILFVLVTIIVVVSIVAVLMISRRKKRMLLEAKSYEMMSSMPGGSVRENYDFTENDEETRSIISEASSSTQPTVKIDAKGFQINFDELQIFEQLGAGTYGKVFRGMWEGDAVAIKLFDYEAIRASNSKEDLDKFMREFENEVAILGNVRGRNILQFRGACTVPPNLAIITELMEGSLYYFLHTARKKFTWKQKIMMGLDIAYGMEFLHKKNLIHRDLKTHNVLIDNRYTAKVADFGLSKVKDEFIAENHNMTQNVGTPLYMSPEVVLGLDYGKPCDVYSFSMILYELFTEKTPFQDEPNKVLIHLQVCKDPNFRPKMNEHQALSKNRKISDSQEFFLDLMVRCWQHDPHERPDFADVIHVLKDIYKMVENEPEAKAIVMQ